MRRKLLAIITLMAFSMMIFAGPVQARPFKSRNIATRDTISNGSTTVTTDTSSSTGTTTDSTTATADTSSSAGTSTDSTTAAADTSSSTGTSTDSTAAAAYTLSSAAKSVSPVSATTSTQTIKVTDLSLNKYAATLQVGSTETLTAIPYPKTATNRAVTWSSNNNAIATVGSSGLVTAVAVGKAYIKGTTVDGGYTAVCVVTVIPSTIIPSTVSVTGVTLDKTASSLKVGGTDTLTATVNPTNASNKNVTWSSSNNTVATVSSSGMVTAVAPGTANIMVKTADGSFTAVCAVTVAPPIINVTGVTLNKTTSSLTVGGAENLTATVSPANATNPAVTWSSSNTGVATVSSTGVVTAVAAGTANIMVTTADGSFTEECAVTVAPPIINVTGVTLNKTTSSLTVNGTENLTATVSPANATNPAVTWSSSNTTVATVSSAGVVTAVAAGTANIIVATADGSFTAVCAVTVAPPIINVTGVTLNKTASSLTVGGTDALTATVNPANASNKDVTWSSSNTAVATVSSAGAVTAVAAGTATITVTTVDGSKTAACQVTVTAAATNYINVKDYGAKGDGSTNDASAIQSAANAAKTSGKTLYLPVGTYYIASGITLYTSVQCEGTILVPNSLSGNAIKIARSVSGSTLSASSLSGLTRGASTISGLSGFSGGTLVFTSSELLIVRDGYSDNYTNNDTMQITNASGGIYPALDCSYTDKTKLTAVAYPYEAPITITGLSVQATGDSGRPNSLVMVNRSNVTLNGISIKNKSTAANAAYGLEIYKAANITVNSPVIDNFQIGNRYGFNLENSANITINDAYITNLYHSLSGIYVKNVAINGGYWDEVIDSHWGSDYVIDGAVIESTVQYCGTNITIQNCTFKNSPHILKIRKDTPEIMGKVILNNITATHTGTGQYYGVYYPDWSAYGSYGRTIRTPDQISITNVTVNMASAARTFYVYVTPYVLAKTNTVAAVGSVNQSGIKVDEGTIVAQKVS